MGSGKSSIGKRLRELLGCDFIDLDYYIEKKNGKTIPEIFRNEGEKGFRQMELDSLKEILSDNRYERKDLKAGLILSLGGGTLTTPECAKLIKDSTYCIYLKASADTLVSNLKNATSGRPMLEKAGNSPENLKSRILQLLSSREKTYENAADSIICTDGLSSKEIVDKIACTERL